MTMTAWGRQRGTVEVGSKPGGRNRAAAEAGAGDETRPAGELPVSGGGRPVERQVAAGQPGEPGGNGSLSGTVEAAHQDATRLVEISRTDPSRETRWTVADPRQILHASDAAVAAVCAHLCTMDTVVYPEISRRVPGSRRGLAVLRSRAREAFSTMRGIQQYFQGDTNRPAESIGELRRRLAELMAAHVRDEDELLRELEARISDSDRRELTERFERAMRHAPTRPHPHLVRNGPFGGHLALRLAGRWDHLLDTLDSRTVAGAPVRAPAPSGLWGWYLLGRPTADAADEAATRTGPGTSAAAKR
jgi:Hemerythrin HHE cation binding domain